MNSKTEKIQLIPGRFYWVTPVSDYMDTTHEWEDGEQPAAYVGNDRWVYLGVDEDDSGDWPVKWVGEEIVMPQR